MPEIGRTFKLLVKELGLELPVVSHKQVFAVNGVFDIYSLLSIVLVSFC